MDRERGKCVEFTEAFPLCQGALGSLLVCVVFECGHLTAFTFQEAFLPTLALCGMVTGTDKSSYLLIGYPSFWSTKFLHCVIVILFPVRPRGLLWTLGSVCQFCFRTFFLMLIIITKAQRVS